MVRGHCVRGQPLGAPRAASALSQLPLDSLRPLQRTESPLQSWPGDRIREPQGPPPKPLPGRRRRLSIYGNVWVGVSEAGCPASPRPLPGKSWGAGVPGRPAGSLGLRSRVPRAARVERPLESEGTSDSPGLRAHQGWRLGWNRCDPFSIPHPLPPSGLLVPSPQEESVCIHAYSPLSPTGRDRAERGGQQLPGESPECWEPGNGPCSPWESQAAGIPPTAPSPR